MPVSLLRRGVGGEVQKSSLCKGEPLYVYQIFCEMVKLQKNGIITKILFLKISQAVTILIFADILYILLL